jgi:hypothetical protein
MAYGRLSILWNPQKSKRKLEFYEVLDFGGKIRKEKLVVTHRE